MDLVDALDASGLVCAVGAGGKKSALYALAAHHDRAIVTATVRIPIFDEHVADVVVTDDPVSAVEATEEWPIGVVPEREREDRYLGYDTETVAELADADPDVDAVLVKADGARMRLFKAPSKREPQIPRNADVVLPIASARAVGKPLTDQHVHRVDRVATLTDRDPGEEIRPADVAEVLAHSDGGLKDVPGDATAIPVVNMVDDADLAAVGHEIAKEIHDRSDVPKVVLTRLIADDPVVDVIED